MNLLHQKKKQFISPFITVSLAKIFEKIFRESLVLEIFWEGKIDYKIENEILDNNLKQISFFKILRKYLSKKIRSIYK
tara:strand:+ start:243 stop:476 length:234 start_codon:yes stop_codon:yes gene_type:complete